MKCRLCSSKDLKLYYTQGNNRQYKFYKCNNCKLINYDISSGLNQSKYTDAYINPEDESHKQNRTQTATYNFIKERIIHRGKLLDIGCGNGKLLILAKNDGWKVKGIELSEFFANAIKNKFGIQVEIANFLDYEVIPDDTFDVVVLRHVLEHLPDSILAMSKINSLLKKDGYAILEFPNIESFDLKLKRFLSKIGIHKKKYSNTYKPGHYNEFCKKSFKFLIRKTNFELIEWKTYSNKYFLNIFYNIIKLGSKTRVLIKKK